jgi:acyl-CoA synthetase (AMP-forming)/AMP-acid ligase II/thioesterase domain-containing protein/acyl carrier protein
VVADRERVSGSDVGGFEERPGLGPWRAINPPDDFERFPDEALDASIGARFEQTALHHGERRAISSPAGTWTYSELLEVVHRRAAALIGHLGSSSPTPVAILADHDGPLVASIMSIVAAGHIVVVLDPSAPEEHSLHVLGESGAALIIHDAAHADQAGALSAAASGTHPIVSFDDLDAEPVELPERGPTDPVMLAFTSGTSGMSKGGIITHGVILNVVRGATNALGVTCEDRMPMLFPTSLAVASYPMFIPLLNGGTLATLDVRGVGLAPVAPFLAEERITLAYMAPTVVRFLVDSIGDHRFPDLRMIALGGEVVDGDVVELTNELFEPNRVANGFGTTETGVITLYVAEPGATFDGTVPSGHPVEDVELIVVDERGEPVEPGESGEIVVSSPHVFAGYWGHDELNRAVLEDDPSGRPGWRRYRTGDLGRIDEHGALVVLGRVDTKVKVRGRFVIVGDVEAALHAREELADAVVAPVRDGGVTELCAVVVPSDPQGFSTTALRAALLEHEEAYRVPTRWLVLDELPRLPNGKLDRRTATEMAERTAAASVDTAPSPTVEESGTGSPAPDGGADLRTIRDLWEVLLPAGVVGPDDDFFHLGGDSLLAAQMLVMLEHRTGVTVPMGELINCRTVRGLAERLAELRTSPSTSTSTVVQPGDESARPRLWFVHDLQGSAYRVRHVAEAMGADQPVWSFESPLLSGRPNDCSTLEAFAARYVKDLQQAQPEGPYWLAGYSFGGICAYEMARQLRREGAEVAFVGVVDVGPAYRGEGWHRHRSPFRPWFGVAKPPPPGPLAEQLGYYRDLARSSPPAFARHLMVRSGVARLIDPFRFRTDLRRHGRVRPEWRLWYAWEEHWKLAATQWDRTSTYAGSMDLFWADGTASADSTMGWGDLVAELRIHRFLGDHEGILEPRGAHQLAKSLRGVLDTLRDASTS